MSFEALVDQAEQMLARRGRVSYALLRRHFDLDEAALADLVLELVEGRRIAADENGTVLNWTGAAGAAAHPVERRQLTVLFCDLVDSTRLSSSLDPEDYGELLYRYQEMCAGVVRRFDCRIAQMLGDGILVYAGYPVAHEDSPERAVRIGLGILDQLRTLNEELAPSGQRLAVRIGIHTGLVVVGGIDRGTQREELALGQAPNVAARIQTLAAPDTLIVSEATQRLLGNLFECEDIGRHRLKGIAEPVTAYRVHGELRKRETGDAAADRSVAPLIGRSTELRSLQQALSEARNGRGSAVLVSGEAGIGKTRLIQALSEEAVMVGCESFDFRGSPHYQDTPLHVVTRVVERLFRWSDQDPPEARLARFEQTLEASQVVPEELVPLLAPLLFLDLPPSRYRDTARSPERQRTLLLDALIEVMRARARSGPLLLVIEDLQWLDPTSLELLERVNTVLAELPVLVAMTCRPEFAAAWSAQGTCSTIELERLDPVEIQLLAEHIAAPMAMSADTITQIVNRADGIPLFVEEITKAVLESGSSSSSIPASLHDSLMARLDRLDTAKSIALDAAVIGREFELPLLQAVSDCDPMVLEKELERLVEGGLLRASGDGRNKSYVFRHVLVRDVAYASMLKRSRREIHERIATALESRFASIREEQPELLALHYFEAGRAEEAERYWRQAGAYADARSAYVEAGRHFTRALDALATLPDTAKRRVERAELLLDLGRVHAIVNGWGSSSVEEFFRTALELSQQAREMHLVFVALSGLRTHSLLLGRVQRGQQLAEELLDVALEARRPAEIMIARGLLGDSLYRLGEIDLAVSQFERGRALASSWQGEPSYAGEDPRVHGLCHLALALWMQGHPARAAASIDEAVELARALDHPLSLAYALRFAADFHQRCRAPATVIAETETLLALAAEQGYAHHAAIASILHGWARAMAEVNSTFGDPVAPGIIEMREGLEAYKSTGAIINLPFFLGLLAEVCALHGYLDEGAALTREALACSAETGERWWDAEVLRTRGSLIEQFAASERGAAGGEAETCYRDALALARRQGARALELRSATALGALMLRGGRAGSVTAPLRALVESFEDGFETPDLRAARTVLAQMN